MSFNHARDAADVAAPTDLPLCVDCDGTLIYTDLLFESFLLLLKQKFFVACLVPLWLLKYGKAATKLRIAQWVTVEAETLPYCGPVLDYVRAERARGRKTVLVTASAMPYAELIAEHVQCFDQVIATEDTATNLSGSRKAARLDREFGEHGYEYIGNSKDDIPVWARAGRVSVVNTSKRVLAQAQALAPIGFSVESPYRAWRSGLKAMRLHQWLKNVLIFVPLLAAHSGSNLHLLGQTVLAFFAFGFCASSVYILNDMLDISADRRHSRKKHRPFASGSLSIPLGLLLKVLLVSLGFGLASLLPQNFLAVLLIYYTITLAYSLRLKAQVIVDVMLLSALYTLRIIAGSAATGIHPSFWLLSFSMFIFLSLALVKRYAEMRKLILDAQNKAAGRGYTTDDSVVLLALGAASGYSAVLVLALYINSSEIRELYATPAMLWFIIPCIAYWTSRVWLKTHRGEMHDDPVVFAAKDWQSLLIGALIAAIGMAASVHRIG